MSHEATYSQRQAWKRINLLKFELNSSICSAVFFMSLAIATVLGSFALIAIGRLSTRQIALFYIGIIVLVLGLVMTCIFYFAFRQKLRRSRAAYKAALDQYTRAYGAYVSSVQWPPTATTNTTEQAPTYTVTTSSNTTSSINHMTSSNAGAIHVHPLIAVRAITTPPSTLPSALSLLTTTRSSNVTSSSYTSPSNVTSSNYTSPPVFARTTTTTRQVSSVSLTSLTEYMNSAEVTTPGLEADLTVDMTSSGRQSESVTLEEEDPTLPSYHEVIDSTSSERHPTPITTEEEPTPPGYHEAVDMTSSVLPTFSGQVPSYDEAVSLSRHNQRT